MFLIIYCLNSAREFAKPFCSTSETTYRAQSNQSKACICWKHDMEMLDPTDTVLISFSVFVRIAPWLLLLWAALRGLEGVVCKVGAQEPPVVRSKLPVLGQAVRLFIQGVTYYENLRCVLHLQIGTASLADTTILALISRKHTNFPILTTFYGTQKVYIVNSPELISQINRQGKSIDGSLPFIHVVYGKLLGMHGGDLDRLTQNASIKNSLLYEFRTMEHAALAAGSESAAEIHGNILRELNSTLDKIALHGSETLDLLVWLQRTMTLATARAIFGRDSPFDHSEDLVDCVW